MLNTPAKMPSAGTLSGKVVVVMGGGRGIGRATAIKLGLAGAFVVVSARTVSQLEDVVAEIRARGGHANARRVDVTNSADLKTLANELRKLYGRVDMLVNSAGLAYIAPLESTSEANWDRVIDTNLKGTYLCTLAMLNLLRKAPGALIVNIASKVGLTGHANVTAYSAAKAGVIGFSRALAQELSAEQIRVVTICPGPVDTPMRWEATPDFPHYMVLPVETIAETILFFSRLDVHATTGEIVIEAIGYDENTVSLRQ